MLTKNINFINFQNKKKSKSILNSLKLILSGNNEIILSLKKNYKNSYGKKILKLFKNKNDYRIVGMGGSILGANAIYDFLNDKIKKKFYFINNLQANHSKLFKKNYNNLIISKSGNTLETIVNFNILVKKKDKNLFITEDKNSYLKKIANELKSEVISHNNYIGGRYSVLSEVGIIPSYLMGLNILNLRKNLKRHLTKDNKSFLKDSVVKLSQIMEKKQYTNLIFLNYCPKFEKFLEWCQQLIAESLGKKRKGFLPIISNVPKDHHSLLQLYLDGPRDKIFYIFNSHETEKKRMNVKKYSKKINYLNNKTLSQIKNAQKNAMINTLKKNKIPFREFKFKNHNEETLSELFSYFILETVFLGKLTNIDPFNQPAVEQVKLATIKLIK